MEFSFKCVNYGLVHCYISISSAFYLKIKHEDHLKLNISLNIYESSFFYIICTSFILFVELTVNERHCSISEAKS